MGIFPNGTYKGALVYATFQSPSSRLGNHLFLLILPAANLGAL